MRWQVTAKVTGGAEVRGGDEVAGDSLGEGDGANSSLVLLSASDHQFRQRSGVFLIVF